MDTKLTTINWKHRWGTAGIALIALMDGTALIVYILGIVIAF